MPFDEGADEDQSEPGVPLPPEDRLWRHPSELGAHSSGLIGPVGEGAGPWAPLDVLDPSTRPRAGRRYPWTSVAAVSCLAGVVITMGLVLATRPTTKVVERRITPSVTGRPVTSVVFKPFPTEELAATVTPAVARLDVQGPRGWQQPASAVLIGSDGTLVTSAELLQGSRKLVVTFDDGRHRAGHIVGVDSQTGIAVLSVAVTGRTGALRAPARPQVGEATVMVGGPGPGSRLGTVATSNVRGVGRQTQGPGGALHDMIEVDRPVLADSAGGALVDSRGQVLGICLPGALSAQGYAVPIDLVRRVSIALREGGKVHWGHLGVSTTDIDPGRAQHLGLGGAAQVVRVDQDSPAAKVGLVEGDLITRLGSSQIQSVTDLVGALSEHHPGDSVVVQFRHGTVSRSVRLILATS